MTVAISKGNTPMQHDSNITCLAEMKGELQLTCSVLIAVPSKYLDVKTLLDMPLRLTLVSCGYALVTGF